MIVRTENSWRLSSRSGGIACGDISNEPLEDVSKDFSLRGA